MRSDGRSMPQRRGLDRGLCADDAGLTEEVCRSDDRRLTGDVCRNIQSASETGRRSIQSASDKPLQAKGLQQGDVAMGIGRGVRISVQACTKA